MMDLSALVSDPHAQLAAAGLAVSLLSTVHTYLDKHPRLQAALRLAAHGAGPLNLPAMKAAGIALCRAVVAYEEDKADAAAAKSAQQETQTIPWSAVKAQMDGGVTPAAKPVDGVKAWPQS